ncbi:MAG: hypothetical protein C6W56_15650 [Caldibacillus debilis]|nr:MAG: hypothetical protein C6W56_15650 [Caldibacillus debilis]
MPMIPQAVTVHHKKRETVPYSLNEKGNAPIPGDKTCQRPFHSSAAVRSRRMRNIPVPKNRPSQRGRANGSQAEFAGFQKKSGASPIERKRA